MNYEVIWGNPIFSPPPIASPMFFDGLNKGFYDKFDEFLKQKSKIVKMKKLIKYYK